MEEKIFRFAFFTTKESDNGARVQDVILFEKDYIFSYFQQIEFTHNFWTKSGYGPDKRIERLDLKNSFISIMIDPLDENSSERKEMEKLLSSISDFDIIRDYVDVVTLAILREKVARLYRLDYDGLNLGYLKSYGVKHKFRFNAFPYTDCKIDLIRG